MNYEKASQLLTGRNHDSRKLANNTYLVRAINAFAIRLHNTNVVTFYADGSVMFNSGGWRTSTTKERMNIGDFQVCQKNYDWFIRCISKTDWVPYCDGITWNGSEFVANTSILAVR